jgi:hypothetical protein
MPEGNEVHRWAERHAAAFAERVVRVDESHCGFECGVRGRFAHPTHDDKAVMNGAPDLGGAR